MFFAASDNLFADITTNSEYVSLTNNLNLNIGDLNSGSSLNFSGILAKNHNFAVRRGALRT